MLSSFPVVVGGVFGLGGPELVMLLILVMFLFGGKKLPELAKGLGQSIKEFKKAANTDSDDEAETESSSTKPAAKAGSADKN